MVHGRIRVVISVVGTSTGVGDQLTSAFPLQIPVRETVALISRQPSIFHLPHCVRGMVKDGAP